MEDAHHKSAEGPLRDIYSVSRLNREAKALLEGSFPPLWVEGEISNLAQPGSGHLYFSLKDAKAQIRCALFRTQQRSMNLAPRDGMQVLVRARVSLYEGRGEFQLIVDRVEDAGEGALRRAFEALKLRLSQEGLFDFAAKKPLPRLPRRIGVITSPTGAVWHDIVITLKRRFPAIAVLLYPVAVQGEGAAEQIASAIALAGRRRDCDALILARGGGSLEDLWAFNEERVARAIHASPIPIVAGIGHESDITIADLVADARAPTPTAASEMLSPDQSEWRELFRVYEQRVTRRMRDRLRALAQHIDASAARLIHPRQRIDISRHRLRALYERVISVQRTRLYEAHVRMDALRGRLRDRSPLAPLRALQQRHAECHSRLTRSIRYGLQRGQEQLGRLSHVLHNLSPLATLARGYAVVRRKADGRIVRGAMTVAVGETIEARVAHGRLSCEILRRHEH
jgi:exodeoxyribonuclease VII large subunit